MQKNGILKKFFEREKKVPGILILFEAGVEKLFDVAEQVRTAFLFGERSDLVPVGVVKVANKNAFVKFTKMINNDLGTPALVNMKKRDERVGENPEPVALPAGFIGVNERRARQRLFQSVIERLPLPGNIVVESNQCARGQRQLAETFQCPSCIVVGTFDFVAEKRSFGPSIRPDECVGNFIFSPAMDNVFAILTPVIAVDKASRGKFAILKVFLDVICSVVAWGNIFAFAKRTLVKINVNSFVYDIRFLAKMAFVSDRSSAFGGALSGIFLLIFGKRVLKRIGQLGFKMSFLILKFLDLRLKLPDLEIGEVHGKPKIVNAFAQISSFFQKRIGRFAFEKYAEFVERAKRMFDDPAWIMVLFFLPAHGDFPNINKIATSKHKEMHPALETAGRSGWYLYNRMMSSFCQ